MPFQPDPRVPAEAGAVFGTYINTFLSDGGQVRADLFRRGQFVEAHVTFPTGLDPTNVTDPYFGQLQEYARQNGFSG